MILKKFGESALPPTPSSFPPNWDTLFLQHADSKVPGLWGGVQHLPRE